MSSATYRRTVTKYRSKSRSRSRDRRRRSDSRSRSRDRRSRSAERSRPRSRRGERKRPSGLEELRKEINSRLGEASRRPQENARWAPSTDPYANRSLAPQRGFKDPSRRGGGKIHSGDGYIDQNLRPVHDDPRLGQVIERKKAGRNTDSFEPESTFVRPGMRICVGPKTKVYPRPLKHDDVIVVPEFFCAEDDLSIYYKLVEEVRALQAEGQRNSEWLSWHEGCHLISKNPKGSPTYEKVLRRSMEYFDVKRGSEGTRFNWYRDSSDWKPFHHDSAAFNAQRARNQNITIGVSFGASRELAFLHAKNRTRLYFPQTNGMLFMFGRDVNINWKHGINALPKEEWTGQGRISIVVWGLAQNVIEEDGSPGMLTDQMRGNREKSNQPCRDFAAGRCRYGDRCRFVHGQTNDYRHGGYRGYR